MLNANRAAYITLIGFCRCRRRRRRCCWRCRRDQKKISTGKMQREWNQKRSNDGIQLQPSNNCAPSAELNSQFPWSEDGRAKENEMMEEPATERKTCLKQMAQQNIKLWLHVICGRREKFTDRWNNNNIIIFFVSPIFRYKGNRFRISFLFSLRSANFIARALSVAFTPSPFRFCIEKCTFYLISFRKYNFQRAILRLTRLPPHSYSHWRVYARIEFAIRTVTAVVQARQQCAKRRMKRNKTKKNNT